MPLFQIQDPNTGRTVELEGDAPPSQRDLTKIFNQLKTPAEKATDIAGDLAVEVGSSLAGQALGAETGPGYLAIAPAAGAYGTYLRQKRQIERGERDDYNYGEMVTSGLVNLVPLSAMAKGGATTAKYIGKVASLGAATSAIPQAVEVGQKVIEEKRFPTYDEYLSVGKKATEGAVIGGIAGAGFEAATKLSPAAKKLWNSLAGKTEAEANATLAAIAQEGSEAERKAAAEMLDSVGRDLGLVRPTVKTAKESAKFIESAPGKTVARETMGEAATAPAQREVISPAEIQRSAATPSRFGSEADAAMAGSRPSPVPAQSAAPKTGERPMGGFGSEAERGGSAVSYPEQRALESAKIFESAVAAESPLSTPTFERAYQEGQTQAAGLALRQRFAEQEYAGTRAQELWQQRQAQRVADEHRGAIEDLARQMEANRLGAPEIKPSQQVLESTMVKGPSKSGFGLPTTEDIAAQFGSTRGLPRSKQQASKMGMTAGNIGVGTMAATAGVGAAGLAALAASEAKAKPDTIIVNTPMGPLKYDPNQMSLDDIQQDVAKKVNEYNKIQAATPHLENRANYENAPTDEAKLQTLMDWSNSRRIAGEAAKTFVQAAGSRLPMAFRPLAGAGGEMARGYISGQPATAGSIVQSGIQSIPRGGTSFGENLLKFAGTNVAGEQAKAAIDRGELINFEMFANAAARGGLQAAATSAVMGSPLASKEIKRQQQNRGEIEVFKDADRLGIVIDPASMTNPTIGQTAAIKLAGGSPRFNQDASRVNTPRVIEILQNAAGKTGNPDLDQNLSPQFFKARLLKEGRAYDAVAKLPGMGQKVEDWKQANFNAAKNFAANAKTGSPESLEAARKFKAEADNLFSQIETTAMRNGSKAVVDELRAARTRIAQLHAIENSVDRSDYKPDNVKALGVIYRDNPNYFTGDLASLARISASQPNVFQDISTVGTKGISWNDIPLRAPGLRAFLQTQPGQRSIGNYGLEPTFLAQLARFGAGAAVPPPQSQPNQ